MSDVRLAVCSWRAVIKGVGLSFLAVFHALLKDVIVIPELLDLFFSVYEIQIRINFLTRPSGAVYSKLLLREVRIPPGGLFNS